MTLRCRLNSNLHMIILPKQKETSRNVNYFHSTTRQGLLSWTKCSRPASFRRRQRMNNRVRARTEFNKVLKMSLRQGRIQMGCPGCPDTRPLLRVPFLDYRSSIASKIDAAHVIKAHSIIQFVMPENEWERLDFQILLGRPQTSNAPSSAPIWWIGHPTLPNPRSATVRWCQWPC